MHRSLRRSASGKLASAALTVSLVVGASGTAPVCRAEDKPKLKGRYNLGPLQLNPRFRLMSGLDTNVFQTLANPTRDSVVILSPRLDGALPVGRRLRLTGSGYADVFYFRRQDDERSIDFAGEGRAELLLHSVTLFGGGGGGQFTQRFSIDVDDRLPRQEKRAYAGATWQVTRRFSLTGRGANEIITFSPGEFRLGGSVKEAMDRNTLSASGQMRFALTHRTALVVSGEALEDRFFSQPKTLPPERQSYRALAGLEFGERAFLTGHLFAGVRD
ncbi:MAG TPA: outer membrane beta-barrel protein, partial [Vicinamibacteria bacterium]|nr:outer membrane beta-barrel protein [Vicinamibacteria bacterium]